MVKEKYSQVSDQRGLAARLPRIRRGMNEDYDSEALQASSARTIDEHMNVAKKVLKLFRKRTTVKSK